MNKSLLIAVVLIASFLLGLRFLTLPKQRVLPTGKTIRIAAVLTSEPEQRGKTQRLVLRPDTTEPLYVTTARYPRYRYGQKILVTGRVEEHVLDEKKTIKTMSFPEITIEKIHLFLLLFFP